MCRWRRTAALAGALILALAPATACSSDQERTPDRSEQGAHLVTAVNELLSLDPDHDSLRAVIAYVDGDLVLEKYFDWPADAYWDVSSVTNTILATLVGIAIDEGAIAGLDQTLGELLPDHRPDMTRGIAATRLRELLRMTAGLAGSDRDKTPEYMAAPDPVGRILGAAPDPLGGGFAYSNQGAHLLAAVLARSTGMSVLDYARSRLFEPLGIDTDPADGFEWPVDRSGLHLGWGSLKLRAQDLLRLGQLFLDGGEWKGERIVPISWVREATHEQAHTVDGDNRPLPAPGYGYGWWLTEADGEPAYFAYGFGGLLVEVVPSRSLVVVVASEVEYDGTQNAGISANSLTFVVDDVIAPALAP